MLTNARQWREPGARYKAAARYTIIPIDIRVARLMIIAVIGDLAADSVRFTRCTAMGAPVGASLSGGLKLWIAA